MVGHQAISRQLSGATFPCGLDWAQSCSPRNSSCQFSTTRIVGGSGSLIVSTTTNHRPSADTPKPLPSPLSSKKRLARPANGRPRTTYTTSANSSTPSKSTASRSVSSPCSTPCSKSPSRPLLLGRVCLFRWIPQYCLTFHRPRNAEGDHGDRLKPKGRIPCLHGL